MSSSCIGHPCTLTHNFNDYYFWNIREMYLKWIEIIKISVFDAILLYPTQRVAEGIMVFFTRPSVSQSCFSCQRNSSETAQQNFIKLCCNEGHNVWIRISTGNFDSIFFLRVTPFFSLEIWQKWKILLKQFVSATPLKPLNRMSWNFVVVKGIPCRCAYLHEILIQFVFLRVTPFLNLEIWPRWKILLNTVC